MFCKQCGNQVADGAKFCTACGTPMEAASETVVLTPEYEQTTVLQTEAPQTEYPQQTQYAQPEPVAYSNPDNAYQNYNYGYNNYNQQPVQPTYQNDEEANKLQGEILTMGILGLVFATSFFLSILGIIFSSIAKKKANQYINLKGQLEGKAKVGFGLAKPGFIVGIIFTIFCAFYFLALIASM